MGQGCLRGPIGVVISPRGLAFLPTDFPATKHGRFEKPLFPDLALFHQKLSSYSSAMAGRWPTR